MYYENRLDLRVIEAPSTVAASAATAIHDTAISFRGYRATDPAFSIHSDLALFRHN